MQILAERLVFWVRYLFDVVEFRRGNCHGNFLFYFFPMVGTEREQEYNAIHEESGKDRRIVFVS